MQGITDALLVSHRLLLTALPSQGSQLLGAPKAKVKGRTLRGSGPGTVFVTMCMHG